MNYLTFGSPRNNKNKHMNTETEITGKQFVEASWKEKVQIGRAVSVIPAVGCFAFIRSDMGYRLGKPAYYGCLFILLCIMAAAGHQLAKPYPCALVIYGAIMLGLGLYQRKLRWDDFGRGRKLHSFYPGLSVLERCHLPLPAFLAKNRRLYRFGDPALVAIAALILGLACHLLGLFLLFSSACVAIFEQDLFLKIVSREWDLRDSLISSEVSQKVVEMIEAGESEEAQQQVQKDAGIPTGIDGSLKNQLLIRKQRKVAPDNLAAQEVARV
jgi:hypothetical protein